MGKVPFMVDFLVLYGLVFLVCDVFVVLVQYEGAEILMNCRGKLVTQLVEHLFFRQPYLRYHLTGLSVVYHGAVFLVYTAEIAHSDIILESVDHVFCELPPRKMAEPLAVQPDQVNQPITGPLPPKKHLFQLGLEHHSVKKAPDLLLGNSQESIIQTHDEEGLVVGQVMEEVGEPLLAVLRNRRARYLVSDLVALFFFERWFFELADDAEAGDHFRAQGRDPLLPVHHFGLWGLWLQRCILCGGVRLGGRNQFRFLCLFHSDGVLGCLFRLTLLLPLLPRAIARGKPLQILITGEFGEGGRRVRVVLRCEDAAGDGAN